MMTNKNPTTDSKEGFLSKVIRFCLENKIFIALLLIMIIAWGIIVAPFDWNIPFLPRNPIPVDAIPDISENQQIVFTKWPGRSPQDIEDQVTYPLTSALLGIPGVKTVRSNSMFGFSSIYVIFDEKVDFYWSRSRILEKLNSLPPGILPPGVNPSLGPDATALGQVFWYTLEGRDKDGRTTGGWDLHELRTVQDWYVRLALLSVSGVSEVASVGGFVQEYQVDLDPYAMQLSDVSVNDVVNAVRDSNIDVGAKTIEINNVEYVIRGLGFIKSLQDLEYAVIKVRNNVPVYIKDVAHVTLGPEIRRGALDKGGAETVGGVVVVRFGANPLEVIKNVKNRIDEISSSLPVKTMPDGRQSRITVVPFYDRTGLIHETLETLNIALTEEVLITIVVVLIMIFHLRSAALIAGLLPVAVLVTFIAMRIFGIDANIIALAGIAIAIGTMVDMGIVLSENIYKGFQKPRNKKKSIDIVHDATNEVGSAVITALLTTVVSFLPVFAMEGAEGKLFKPLAYTKTFALFASMLVSLIIIPPIAHVLFRRKSPRFERKRLYTYAFFVIGLFTLLFLRWWLGLFILSITAFRFFEERIPKALKDKMPILSISAVLLIVIGILAGHWLPMGPENGLFLNFLFVIGVLAVVLLPLFLFYRKYGKILVWCLRNKGKFLSLVTVIVLFGILAWVGFGNLFSWLPEGVEGVFPLSVLSDAFPGLGKEFMPPLDEGAFLFMPTTMPHASIGEVMDVLQKQDTAIQAIAEVEQVVGKLGRAESPLDPAPISMIETVINYKQKYLTSSDGKRLLFKFDSGEKDYFRNAEGEPLPALDGLPYYVQGKFVRSADGKLIPDAGGMPFRLWRPELDPSLNPGRKRWEGINKPDDIWQEIVRVSKIPGTTSAPKLQPISARIVMLQTGMRAPMGIKVKGQDLEQIEAFGMRLERLLKQVPSIKPSTVIADRIVGKPYLEIEIDRRKIARYGIRISQVQSVIEHAIGGKRITTTVEGRERFPVRVRYPRELRNTIESLGAILIKSPGGSYIPLKQLAEIKYVRGPQSIKSESNFLISYVLFDKEPEWAEVDVVENAIEFLEKKEMEGELVRPEGISYEFTGTYENQIRATKRLSIILPLSLFIIFMILYFKFKSVKVSFLIFGSILVAWSGGFIMLWLYGQDWFLRFSLFGVDMRELFQVHTTNLSVAVWVGFLALFGIASDNSVLISSYLEGLFSKDRPKTKKDIHQYTLKAAEMRIRPALMTTATTILALIPVLTSSGRGSDVLVPMAIPTFGGMTIAVVTMLVTPVVYSWMQERAMKRNEKQGTADPE